MKQASPMDHNTAVVVGSSNSTVDISHFYYSSPTCHFFLTYSPFQVYYCNNIVVVVVGSNTLEEVAAVVVEVVG